MVICMQTQALLADLHYDPSTKWTVQYCPLAEVNSVPKDKLFLPPTDDFVCPARTEVCSCNDAVPV